MRSIETTPGFLRRLCGVATLTAALQLTTAAHAALGDEVASVENDRAIMQANLRVSSHPNYDVHELATATGATVREFVNQDGKVFAVSWSGGWRPNLRDILGKHYDRFIEGTRGRPGRRGPARLELPGLVVFMHGHLRSFYGFAYLSDLLPAGFLPEDVK
jgi:hypothetical protein